MPGAQEGAAAGTSRRRPDAAPAERYFTTTVQVMVFDKAL